MKLSDLLDDALLAHEGDIGRFLQFIESSERLDEMHVLALLAQIGLSTEDWNRLTLEAHLWMLGAIHDQQDMRHG